MGPYGRWAVGPAVYSASMADPPAALLEGLVLDGGWRVGRRITRPVAATGGCLSASYLVVREDGTEAFLKALDLSHALEETADPVKALSEMTQAYLHEWEVLEACSRARLTHVVLGLDSGYALVEGHGPLSRVPYLILERADGDVRRHLDLLPELDVAWALRTLHHVAVGLRQLHSQRIYHQDTKPSNVLVFPGGERKVGDLGQAVRDGHESVNDSADFAGDPNYAPLERRYGYRLPDDMYCRMSCDMYHLGSMLLYFFAGVGTTAAVFSKLHPSHYPAHWPRRYADVLPHVRDAFDRVVDEFDRLVGEFAVQMPEHLHESLVLLLRELCDPDPAVRGDARARAAGANPYGLERYVSRLNRVAREAELELQRAVRR